MSSSTEKGVKGNEDVLNYYLPRNPNESERLEIQHRMVDALFGWEVHPKLASLSNVRNVLDIATGTTIWLREARSSFPSARLVGVDLSAGQFPDPKPSSISHLFTHNALDPFPAEHIAAYDIVHQRFLVVALTRAQWATELSNVLTLLKPGGWAQIAEVDLLVDEGNLVSDSARLAQRVVTVLSERADMDLQPSVNIASQLVEAGFTKVETDARHFRVGKDSDLPTNVQDLGFTNFESGWRSLLRMMLEKRIALENVLSSEEKIDSFVDRLMDDYRKDGVGYKYSVTIARRPS